MTDFATLRSCTELTTEHAKLAARSSEGIRSLLARVSVIAKPSEGCPKVLMAVARLVGQDWIEGELRVELSGDDVATTMIIMCDYGAGIRERLIPMARFAVPIDEFGRALELSPKLVMPLRVSEHEGLIILTPLGKGEAQVSLPAPALTVDSLSLGSDERATAPPPPDELQVVDEATPGDAAVPTPRAPTPPAPGVMLPELDDPFADELVGAGAINGASHEGQLESGERIGAAPADGRSPNVHTRPTVRRMVAVDAAAIAALKRRDPRREED